MINLNLKKIDEMVKLGGLKRGLGVFGFNIRSNKLNKAEIASVKDYVNEQFENETEDEALNKYIIEAETLNECETETEVLLNEFEMYSEELENVINAVGNYFKARPEGVEQKYCLVMVIKEMKKFFENKLYGHSYEEKSELIEKLKKIYFKCYNLDIMLAVSELQSRWNMKDNIIKSEIGRFICYAAAWVLYAKIEKDNFKSRRNVLDNERFRDALSSSIHKYEKALEIDEYDYEILNGAADCYKMKGRSDDERMMYLNKAEELFIKSLEVIKGGNDENKLSRELMMSLQGIAEVYRRKLEIYINKNDSENIEVCIEKINDCYDTIENMECDNKVIDKDYYFNRNKAYFNIAIYYKNKGNAIMAKAYIDAVIQSYNQKVDLYKKKNVDTIMRCFITKASIYMHEGRRREAEENIEMALSLKKRNKNIKPQILELLDNICRTNHYETKTEEGVIYSIPSNGESVVIHCRDCNKLHYAHISEFKESYTLEQLEEMKNSRQKLRFTPLRTYKYPAHDECIRNAHDVEVMNENITEEYEKIEVSYPEDNSRKAVLKRRVNDYAGVEENIEKLRNSASLKLVQSGYIGRLEFFNAETGFGIISNKKDDRVVKVALENLYESEEDMEDIIHVLETSGKYKAFVKFDLYEISRGKIGGVRKYTAKNIEVIF